MQGNCAFREHTSNLTEHNDDKAGPVLAWRFECDECTAVYTVSEDLLELYAKRWENDVSGANLARLAKRGSAQGNHLKLITEQDVKWALSSPRGIARRCEIPPRSAG
jgi:hypothetical protein